MPAVDRPHNRGPEGERVHDLPPDAPWRFWGPYQSGRKWGTVPTGSGRVLNLAQAADELSDRLIGLFRGDAEHRRPSQPHDHPDDPLWNAHPTFSEYFHGDTGEGLGASHQTGWTALVAHLICFR